MSAQHESPEVEVAAAATAWMAAAFRRDLDACARILADAFTMVTDRGSQIDKAGWLANMAHRVGGDTPPTFLDPHVLVIGDAALMRARNLLRATFDGKEWSVELYLTDVWVRQGGAWRIVRRHASRVVADAD